MLASVVDAVNVLTRVMINANSSKPITDSIPRVTRPYENPEEVAEKDQLPTTSLADFAQLLKKGDT